MPTHTSFRGVSDWGESLLSDQLEANLVSFFSWASLGAGGFFDVRIPSSGAYGGDMHRLRRAEDPNYDAGQVWEAFRKDWVWESGVENPRQPIRVSGVYVGGTFHPATGVGPYAHTVDYPHGRVVFASGLPANSVVTCEYSYRGCQWVPGDSPWWREVQTNSLRVDDGQFLSYGSGAWSTLSQSRVQLPAVVVEATPNARRHGTALGGGNTVTQEVQFHVLAETPYERKFLHDLVAYQWQKRLVAYDRNLVFALNRFPLDENGSPSPSGLMYPSLIKPSGEGGCGWERHIRFVEVQSTQPPRSSAPLYTAVVRGLFEVDLP
jgi:hypothetical protein